MSAIYDNWERLVAAVLRKEQLWQLCHADSIDTSTRSESLASDFAASPWILQEPASPYSYPPNFSRDILLRRNIKEYEEAVSTNPQYPGFYSSEVVLPRETLKTLRKEEFAVPYRSEMENGITTVAKRLRDAGVSERHVDLNAVVPKSLNHENVASDEVFFSYVDEMLIIYEYESPGGVSTFLPHGKKKSTMYELEWESRVRIAICVARAIADTHSQRSNKLVRGDMKSTNDCFSALGLESMVEVSIVIPTAGYSAPEIDYDQPPSQTSDIYSFGVLLIELLTGAVLVNDNIANKMMLVRRVTRKFLEVGTLVVFDFVPVRSPAELIEMWKMLLVAVRCLEENPEQRPESSDVVRMMEDI